MKPSWFSSDLHFGHENIISFCKRPFANTTEMNQPIIRTWNETIEPDAVVWVLGDIALGPIKDTLPLVSSLNGHLVQVPGNHDRNWRGHGTRADDWDQRYLDAGFEAILHGDQVLNLTGRDVLVSHFPYVDRDARYLECRPVDDGLLLMHGHVHDRWKVSGRMLNVGLDAWGGRPVSLAQVSQILDLMPLSSWAHAWVSAQP